MRRIPLIAAILFLAIAILGCAAIKHNYNKTRYIEAQVQTYTYTTDFDYVWQQARSLLFQNGYHVAINDKRSKTMETDWARITTKDNTFRRYLITGYRAADGSNTVHFDFYEETRNPGHNPVITTGRDFELEYALIHIVEPQNWAQIERDAIQYADSKADK